jgi:GntR family transcriptional regulator
MSSSLATSLRDGLAVRRRSGQPRYQQLREALRDLIRDGVAGPGGALPAERELARITGWSRVTVRKALAGLVEQGVVNSKPGAGTYVGERIVRSFSRLTSFTDDLRARGLDPRVVFLERGHGEATPDEAMALALAPGSAVVRLHRLRFAAERPLAVERTVVPQSILPSADRVSASLYEALESLGAPPDRALQRLRAVAVDAATADLLQLPVGSPGLAIERRAFLADGRAVEFTRSVYRADAYDFVAELTRT